MSALVEGARESAEMVKLLGKLLRSSIEINSVEILLKDEIATAESYLKIQSFRYRKRLEYTIDTDAVNDGYKVIPYIFTADCREFYNSWNGGTTAGNHNCLKSVFSG